MLAIFGYSLYQCGQVVAPTGGPKDEKPPKLILEESTENYQTNFTNRSFQLTFDEWISVNNPQKQIVVTPPVQYGFSTALKKRTLIFEFDEKEELRVPATYIINFGESVKDLTEGNKPEKLRFVFSTGPFIDSLSVKVEVTEAKTGKPLPDIKVMLYDQIVDSLVYVDRPFYYGITDKKGKLTLENLRADTFMLVGLEDLNLNFQLDDGEGFAFADTSILIKDSLVNTYNLKLSRPIPNRRILSKSVSDYGMASFTFNLPPDSVDIVPLNKVSDWSKQIVMDTLKVWYKMDSLDSWELALYAPKDWADTIKIRPARSKRAYWLKNLRISPYLKSSSNANKKTREVILQDRTRPFQIKANQPLKLVEKELIGFSIDSLGLTELALDSVKIDPTEPDIIRVYHSWEQDSVYFLSFLPQSIQGWHSNLKDTTYFKLKGTEPPPTGRIILHFLSPPDTTYLINLKDKKGDLAGNFIIRGNSSMETTFENLLPGEYSLEIIEDTNNNNTWDPCDFSNRTQPERIAYYNFETLRANWDLDDSIDFNVIFEIQDLSKSKENKPALSSPNSSKN